MKKKIVSIMAVTMLVTGCAGVTAPGTNVESNIGSTIKYVHDDVHKVGIWFLIASDGHLSVGGVLPDSLYTVTK